jgi:hypothetical protein
MHVVGYKNIDAALEEIAKLRPIVEPSPVLLASVKEYLCKNAFSIMYALYELEGGDDYDHIDPQRLPFDICEGVRLENTSGLIDCAWCEKNEESIGTFSINALKTVRLAIVHRYEAAPRCNGRIQKVNLPLESVSHN